MFRRKISHPREMRIFAHRGASRQYPENTLIAFEAALHMGANGIECDVQLTKDGQVVIFHDISLQRTTNGSGLVRQHTLSQLKKLDAGSWFDPRFRHTPIPSLEEVLRWLKSQPSNVCVNIELKNVIIPQPDLEKKLIHTIRKHGLLSQTIFSTYNMKSLIKIKKIEPTAKTALLYFGRLNEPWKVAKQIHAQYVHPPADQTNEELVQFCHREGLEVHPYGVNDVDTMRYVANLGVEGMITEKPKTAKKISR